ncbi:Uncharacterised protein [BD1-7 clade bacterium]|uniref:Uncharacterized protein n=1 Tax=BD1-7 clade bacterium TaxID=2029982 RepID=A0A5S9QZ57_9GAMM|nr:Uncharacterised protein [BD1-7 clade bacterium]
MWADDSGEHTSASIIYIGGLALGTGIGTGTWLSGSEGNEYTIYDSNKLTVPSILGLTMDTTLAVQNSGGVWAGTITPTKCHEDSADYCSYIKVGEPIQLQLVNVDGTNSVEVEFELDIVVEETVNITYSLMQGSTVERLLELGGQMPE